MAQQKSVTLVISHVLDPEHGQRYEAWLGKIMPIAAEFPGHLGANVIRPAPGQNLWSVIIRFDTIEHLYAWTQSETRRQLDHGKALMEMLKQPLYQPKSDAEQVVTLVLASHGVLDELPTAELRAKTSAFVRQFHTDPSGVMDEIQASGKLSPEQVQTILNAWNAFAGGDAHAIH